MSDARLELVNPPELEAPRGYAHGVAGTGRVLFVAGQIGSREGGGLEAGFAAQFCRALDKVLTVVRAAGGSPDRLARLTLFVVDKYEYLACTAELRRVWRERLGDHYPAMTLVEVKGLLDDDARLELEATALL